jgi:hypothetical protein
MDILKSAPFSLTRVSTGSRQNNAERPILFPCAFFPTDSLPQLSLLHFLLRASNLSCTISTVNSLDLTEWESFGLQYDYDEPDGLEVGAVVIHECDET